MANKNRTTRASNVNFLTASHEVVPASHEIAPASHEIAPASHEVEFASHEKRLSAKANNLYKSLYELISHKDFSFR